MPQRSPHHPLTYYQATAPDLHLPPLVGDHEAEVAVFGAGFAGLAVACGLQDRGMSAVTVLEAHAVGHGASGRNGGFALGGYSRDPARLLADWGPEPARQLYGLTRDALALIRHRVQAWGIECDLIHGGAWWVDWFNTRRSRQAMAAHGQMLREHFGVQWEALGPAEVRAGLHSDRYGGALWDREAFHFHPLRYAQGMARAVGAQGGHVHPDSPVVRVERQGTAWLLHTPQGRLRATHLVVAGGGYLRRVLPRLERARLPIATYMLATEPLAEHPVQTTAAVYDNRFAFDYYRRPSDGRLLWGGRISILERHPERIARMLKADVLKVFPQLASARIEFAWGGLMSYATHEMPQLGRLSDGLWFAQSFGGHGVAPTTVAGELLAELMARGGRTDERWQRYGLTPVFGRLGLLGAQAHYSWAELKDALHEALTPRSLH
ncbi:MAG: FAD-binding oxidoreductase [Inhella sp.]|jgi:glycine/D-amino acid oxidase-like deaminating enzyme|uniref:NAD(P)/FAD-dependent oxidoreductase n=1 Tax=Inhella sp. TaxID=1921806 RepID=UPI0022C99385|nr:FAD-binding oxidoreductase [Inhella sp.]MCZ8235821.1 FAD-binding oxidoreductase [Inhella sp.]